MAFSYLGNRKWSDISREERFFCSHLYFAFNKELNPFLNLLRKINILSDEELNSATWESAFEVCFYRDIVHRLGYNGIRNIGATKFKDIHKRTFDLCLFSEKHLIIIEAKAQGGFETKQMNSFNNDLTHLRDFIPTATKITLIGLASSIYKPKETTKKNFSKIISWKDIHGYYPDPLFLRADSVFRK